MTLEDKIMNIIYREIGEMDPEQAREEVGTISETLAVLSESL